MRGTLLILLLLPAAAFAQDYYGAIAYSPRSKAHGWAFNHSSQKAAQNTALSNCRRHAPDCKTVVWFLNACAALAIGEAGYGSAWGSTQAAADKEALKLCATHTKDCAVVRRVCTEGQK
jgi:hypothetical protein